MKATTLAMTLLLGFASVGTAQAVEAAPLNAAPAFSLTLSADVSDHGDLLHAVKGVKKSHHGHRRHRSLSRHGFKHRGFGFGTFGHRGFRGHTFGNRGFNRHGLKRHNLRHRGFGRRHGGKHFGH